MEEGSKYTSFNFPRLTELVLEKLTNLKCFYPGKHALDCPSLKMLGVYRCEALRMFSFNHLDFQQPDQVDEMPFRQALFSIEKVSPNLEILALDGKDALEILNSRQENLFQKIENLGLQCFDETPTTLLNLRAVFPNFENLQVFDSSFETLFLTGEIEHLSTRFPKKIRILWLVYVEQLRCIWPEDFPVDHLIVHDLEKIFIGKCPNLISLAPSSMSFKNLTYLKVDNCKGLIYLITSSTAKSLVRLTKLVISNCEMMSVVVRIDEEKAEEDIIFENLEELEFTSLSSLRSFCYGKHTFIFPSLLFFIVEGCPRMKIFSPGTTVAPYLIGIQVENEKMRWKGDLNTTIEQLFIEQGLL